MKEKEYLFSNFKAFLIVTVVLGHFVQTMPAEPMKNFVMLFIYSFHMPAFLFVSGYFSKNVEKCHDKAFERYFITFVYMSFIYFILRFIIIGDLTFRFIVPTFATWYLLVLFYYKWSIKYLIKIKYIVWISIVATLISGMIPIINDKYALGRCISYLPIFLLGYYCSTELLEKVRKIPRWVAGIVLLAISGLFYWYTATHEFYYNAFLNSAPYSNYGFTWWQGMLFKSYFMVMAMLMIGCFLILFSNKKKRYSYIGDHTMSVYALHGAAYMVVSNDNLLSHSSIVINFALAIALTVVVVFALSLPKVDHIYMLGAEYMVKAENRLLYGKKGHVEQSMLHNSGITNTTNQEESKVKKSRLKKRNKKYFILVPILLISIVGTIIIVDNSMQKKQNSATYISVPDSARYIDFISDEVVIQKDIIYSNAVNYKGEMEQLKLDVYEPADDNEKNRPAIIWMHGGGFTGGSKDTSEFEKDLAIDLAKKGYVTVTINYRLRDDISADPMSAVKDSVEDAAAAYRWIQENSEAYGIDKNHIAFAGYSAGATSAIHLCYSDLKTDGVDKCNIFGVVDLAGGRIYTGQPEVGDPACLIIHGTKDTTVSFSDSEQLARDLNKKSIHNTFYTMQGVTHDLKVGYDDILNQITMFLYKELTNQDITITTKTEISYEYRKVEQRIQSGPVYHAKQIPINIDGELDE